MSPGERAIQVGKESRSGRGCAGTVPVRRRLASGA